MMKHGETLLTYGERIKKLNPEKKDIPGRTSQVVI